MNDGYERRALLLHVGSVLRTISHVVERERDDETIAELIEASPILADVALIEYVWAHMTVREFADAALHAFCLWPQLLLEDALDHDALAAPVREHLFAGNPGGWVRYTASLRADVPWFGDPVAAHGANGHYDEHHDGKTARNATA